MITTPKTYREVERPLKHWDAVRCERLIRRELHRPTNVLVQDEALDALTKLSNEIKRLRRIAGDKGRA